MLRRRGQLLALAVLSATVFGCGSDSKSPVNDGDGNEAAGGESAAGGEPVAGGEPADMAGGAGMPDEGEARASSCYGPSSAAIDQAWRRTGFCAWEFASGLGNPRGIAVDEAGNLLVVQTDNGGSVVSLSDTDENGVIEGDEAIEIASAQGLNHGIAVGGGYLYASSSTAVYRWEYSADRQPLGSAETVVSGTPSGGHSARGLAVDSDYLYVGVGSGSNVDANSNRARMRRFRVGDLGGGTLDYDRGELFADGMRNETGLGFDSQGRLWGVENGIDNAFRDSLGGDVHEDNPGEELNLFAEPGRFYGYPYCFSEGELESGDGRGTQWAHEGPDRDFLSDGTHDDSWCKNPENVVPPVLSMQAHSAPLGLAFYHGNSFPQQMDGGLFVTFHGSWNRSVETGYKVVYIPFSDGMPVGPVEDFLRFDSNLARGGAWQLRPVGIAVGARGELFVTSDNTNQVIAIGYEAP